MGPRLEEHLLDRVEVIAGVACINDVPAVRAETHLDVVRAGEVHAAVDGDLVVVEHAHQPVEPEVTREGRGLVADSFHHAPVACDDPSVVRHRILAVDRPQVRLGDGHSHRVRESLAQRPRGDLDPRRVPDLGMPRCCRTPLPEALDVVELQTRPGEEQHRVLEDRRVTPGEDEPVTVGPCRVGRVETHHPRVEDVRERGERHCRPLVAALRRERSIHGEPPYEGKCLCVLFIGESSCHVKTVIRATPRRRPDPA